MYGGRDNAAYSDAIFYFEFGIELTVVDGVWWKGFLNTLAAN